MTTMDRLSIGVRVASRTSGGGRVFTDRLVEALLEDPQQPRVTEFMIGDVAEKKIYHERHRMVGVVPSTSAIRERLIGRRALRSALKKHPVDILLCPGTATVRLRETPVVIWPLTVAPFESEARAILGNSLLSKARINLLRALIVRACNQVDGAIFSSRYAMELHERHARRLSSVPTSIIHPAPSLPDDARTDKEKPRGPRPQGPLMYVSHLYPYKMVDEMLQGYAMARRNGGLRSPLLIAGKAVDRQYEARLHQTVRALGLEDDVQFLGTVSPRDLPKYYSEARAFIFPSLSENAGSYALIDAFAYGVPVISSSASSMPEIVGDAGLYFDPHRPESLSACLEHLISSPAVEETLAQKSADRGIYFPRWDSIAVEFQRFASTVTGTILNEGTTEER